MNNNDDESNVNHNKYIVNVSYSDIAFQCCRRDCFTVLRTNNMIRLVNRKIKKQWYMRKNEREGDPDGEKSISGVTEVRGKRLPKNILTIPLQSCSLLYYNTHVHAHTHSQKKKKKKKKKKQWEKLWELLLPHCWWQVGQNLLKTLWTR